MSTTELVGLPEVGDHAEPWTFGPITQSDIVRYAGASGDFNPIHHDDQYAKAAGFPGVFSIGMLQAGLLASFAAQWLGEENVRRFQVRFKEQVWPGDSCTCSRHRDDGGRGGRRTSGDHCAGMCSTQRRCRADGISRLLAQLNTELQLGRHQGAKVHTVFI